MRFILDQSVPEPIRLYLVSSGHKAVFSREHIMHSAPDDAVVALAEAQSATVVAVDRDFKRLIKRVPDKQKRRFPHAGLVNFEGVTSPRIEERLKAALPFIEAEHLRRNALKDRRIIIHVRTQTILIET